MKLNQKLNLVIPIDLADGTTIHAHSAPLSEDTFDQNWLLISKTYAGIYGEGLTELSGPRIAAKMLKRISIQLESVPGRAPGSGAQADALMTEIRRTTMVITPEGNYPLEEAISKGKIDASDRDVLENAIVFFTVVSAMQLPRDLTATMATVCGLWSAQTSFLNSTDFANSLKKPTEPANTGKLQVSGPETEPSPAKAAGSLAPS